MWFVWLLLALPIIEIALFIQVGGLIGLWPTLALVIATSILGVLLLRAQGAHAMGEIQRNLSELRDPARPLAHRMLLMIAALLLVLPGFFTDAAGALLLIPAIRNALMRRMARRVQVTRVRMEAAAMRRDPHRPPYGDGVIDGDYIVTDDDPQGSAPPAPPDLPPELPDDLPPPRGRRGSGWTRH